MKRQVNNQLIEGKLSRKLSKVGAYHLRWMCRCVSAVVLAFSALAQPSTAQNVVKEWNQNAMQAIRIGNTHFTLHARVLAMVHVAMFDAINGINCTYTAVHVDCAAYAGASRRAAGIQAAYEVLVSMYPSQKPALDAALDQSLTSITDDGNYEDSQSIVRGRLWGHEVAQDVLAWRSTDGLSNIVPPFLGVISPGQWRSLTNTPMPNPQLATMVPFAMTSSSQFRTAGPPSLSSSQYASDVQEVQWIGSVTSSIRTPEQTAIAFFWTDPAALHWNRIAHTVLNHQNLNLLETARLFAALNVAMADGMIANWDTKINYNFWRPITAIRLADTDGNSLTIADPTWTSLIGRQISLNTRRIMPPSAQRQLSCLRGSSGTITNSATIH